MEGAVRGMPLLSGPVPPQPESKSCRKCNKEFNFLFTRSRVCNHCGYSYCHSCSDHQALLPRSGTESGYDPVYVCAFCIDLLTMTASGRAQLRSLPVSKLRNYLASYGLTVPAGAVEKGDLVDLIITSRDRNGCLPKTAEDYYRKHSVPTKPERPSARGRGEPSRAAPSSSGRATAVDQRQTRNPHPPPPSPEQNRSQPRPAPPPASNRPRSNATPPRGGAPRTAPSRPATGSTASSAPASSRPSAAPRPAPPPPIPALSDLLNHTPESLSMLSIGTLKGILTQNHVNTQNLVEKEDLVTKVRTLVQQERAERERVRMMHDLEDQEALAREEMREIRRMEAERATQRELQAAREREREAHADRRAEREQHEPHIHEVEMEDAPAPALDVPNPPVAERCPSPAPPAAAPAPPPPPSSMGYGSLSGKCVVCQDDEANIAIVDCGHLALCMACSQLIWQTTRECPLCRTRIVTEQRFLRIYRS